MTDDEVTAQALKALKIDHLNAMQRETIDAWSNHDGDMMVLAPTGSGKTLAFLAPLLLSLKSQSRNFQAIVIAPSRELVQQIFNVLKRISPLTTTACCYGGHDSATEKRSLESHPSVVVSTPGRLLDHLQRGNITTSALTCLVLDEFDKTLELGFDDEMRTIMSHVPTATRKILTSATVLEPLPGFVKLKSHITINYLMDNELKVEKRISLWHVKASDNNKLDTLLTLLHNIPDEPTIVFAGSRENAQIASNFLSKNKMKVVLYHGALQQVEREKAVAMFSNGTVMVMVATDLAARGLDITSVKHIIHYDLPSSQEAFVHRNGRTARADSHGHAYIITAQNEPLPHYVSQCNNFSMMPQGNQNMKSSTIATLHISAGKKEKVSRADIMGFLTALSTKLSAGDIGKINVYDHFSLVAVPQYRIHDIIEAGNHTKLKKLKVKLSVAVQQLRLAKPTVR